MKNNKLKDIAPLNKKIRMSSYDQILDVLATRFHPILRLAKYLLLFCWKIFAVCLAIVFKLIYGICYLFGLKNFIKGTIKSLTELKKSIFDDHFFAVDAPQNNIGNLKEFISKPMKFAASAMIVAFLFFIVWGSLAPLDSAAIAAGHIISQSSNKMIQHQEGGVIERILVDDGSEVFKDQVLLVLNDTAIRAKAAMLISQLRTMRAMEIRLNAEKEMMESVVEEEKKFIVPIQQMIPIQNHLDKLEAIVVKNDQDTSENLLVKGPVNLSFDDHIFDISLVEVKKLLRTQEDLYQSSRRVINSEISVFHQRISQRIEENKGLAFQQKSLRAQLVLLLEELQSLESLNEKQLVAASKLLGMKRAVEECKGHVGKIDHEISKNLEAITEDQSHITKTISDHFKDIYKELRQVQDQVLELNEQYRTVIDLLGRMEIKSPVDGYVTSLAYHTIGGVITPGTKIMEIVPKADKLIVEVKVNIRDIENIHVGQYSKIQLSAYKSKLVPRLSGTVTYVSADKIQDYHQNGGQPYYIAKVEIDQEELKNVNYDVKLVPGMPAEVYIVKGTRTMLQLLLSPLIDSFHKAFKEA